MSIRFDGLIKAHKNNHNEDTHESNLLAEFPTVLQDKQKYVSDRSLKSENVTYATLVSSIMGEKIHFNTCDIYVNKITDEEELKSFFKLTWQISGGYGMDDIYSDLRQPVIMSFNENTNTLDVVAKTFKGFRTIASTTVVHLEVGSHRNKILVDVADLKRLVDVSNCYYKKVNELLFLDIMHNMSGEEETFRALALFAMGHTPKDFDLRNISYFVDALRYLANDLEDLADTLYDYQCDETPDKDDGYSDEGYEENKSETA